jgi:23S rRNA pseudouridine1911/1915/1917 synthase
LIDDPLAPHPRDPRRVVVAREGSRHAKAAKTPWRRTEVSGGWGLVTVDVGHAYRHQIRAHLASIGHPIAGDTLYGGESVPGLGDRHALHASYVAWAGDEVVPGFAVEAPLPEELRALLAR